MARGNEAAVAALTDEDVDAAVMKSLEVSLLYIVCIQAGGLWDAEKEGPSPTTGVLGCAILHWIVSAASMQADKPNRGLVVCGRTSLLRLALNEPSQKCSADQERVVNKKGEADTLPESVSFPVDIDMIVDVVLNENMEEEPEEPRHIVHDNQHYKMLKVR